MPSSATTSQYVLYVSNVSGDTRTSDVKYEFARKAGRVYNIERDYKSRSALVEMDRAVDAEYAYRKLEGYYMDGREWRVDYATPSDFKFFGWKWTEGGNNEEEKRKEDKDGKNSSKSRSRSRSPPRSSPARDASDSPVNTKQ